MAYAPNSQSPAVSGDRRPDALAELKRLRGCLSGGHDARADIDGILGTLTTALDQVMDEHRGMAEELLSAYEQLGVVFEVTRRLPNVQGESEVVELFTDNLRSSFMGRRVVTARPLRQQEWSFDGQTLSADHWLARMIHRTCTGGAVTVEPPGENGRSVDRAWRDIAEIMVGPVRAGETPICAILLMRPRTAPGFRAVDMLLVESLTTFCGDLIRNIRLVRELSQLSMAMVRSLVSAVDQKDEYTCGHSLRVAFYATQLGRRLKLRDLDLQMLQWSALLHDVGKIGIRDAVLKKAGKLTDEEFAHVKEHPVRSHKVVEGIPQLALALDGILYHHERYDGRGYPKGLRGEEIPLQARIIQIADVFDALTSDRSYRNAFDWRKALSILKEEAGKTVDPDLQGTFDAMIREFLGDDPDAWSRMISRANCFTQETMEDTAVADDAAS